MTIISEIESIAPLVPTTDIWFVDIWGVVHNGVAPFENAVRACQTFRANGGHVLLLSNSPRPREGVIRQLDDIGVARSAYDFALTSGDVSRLLIAAHDGESVWHVGPARDVGIFDGLNVKRGTPDEASVIVCTGLFDDETESAADYVDRFRPLAERGIAMICANPDKHVERGGRIIPCAGLLADEYQRLGGPVLLAGKPHQPIYDAALAWAAEALGQKDRPDGVDRSRVLAIGDGAHTDIAGAAAAGLRSIFVQSRVSMGEDETLALAAARLFANMPGAPIAVMRELTW